MYYSNRYSHMVQEYNVSMIRNIMQKRERKIAKLKTSDDANKYICEVRRKIKTCFAPFPRKTALKAKITETLYFDDFTIEKVLFQSRPNFYVTGNLYLPKKLKKKNPAVLGLCGHSLTGKAEPVYQTYAQVLASKGFIVFVIDPISQGERRQFFPRDGGKRPGICPAHNMMGNQMLLTDDFFGTWRVWDAIRGLDYLLSRPEVDSKIVGVTGNSGGGTLTSFVAALDDRITMIAPSCYICSVASNVESEVPADAEQNPPGFLFHGLDHVDLLIAAAPKPTLIMGQYHDFFSARHTLVASKDLKKIFRLLDKEDKADLFIGPTFHGYSPENRNAMVKWFMTHAGIKGNSEDGPLTILPTEQLNVTPSGEIKLKNAKRVFEFTAEKAAILQSKRKKLSIDELQYISQKLLQLPKANNTPPYYRALNEYARVGKKVVNPAEFTVETEPGIQAIVSVFGNWNSKMHPPTGNINVYVGHISSQDDIENIPSIRKLTELDIPLVSIDPRGIGQSTSKSCADTTFFQSYGSDYMYAMIGDMSKRSYLGQRVFDIIRSLDFLYAEGATEITIIGRGLNSITVAFAALLHNKKPKVVLMDYLPSYQLITESPLFSWPASSLLRGVLKYFDLPDVYDALGTRLSKKNVWNQKMTNEKQN